ncbi:hypothetical protein FRB99_002379 [Tulasnella sp. 403]|nr:hypothetical protein FRB99_002379 [Tulasnella sp. 403]
MLFKLGFVVSLLSLATLGSAKVIDIKVGGADLVYTPPTVEADVGDVLRFHFGPKNHSVTQSSFWKPCTPLKGGFDSGFMPVSPDQTDNFPYFDVHVTNTHPIWVHCQQTNHCPQGMVFAANPHGRWRSFENFKWRALAVGTSAAPAPTQAHGYSAKFRRNDDASSPEAENAQ